MSMTEGKYRAEFIVSESPGNISRDTVTVTVPASKKLLPGQVLGIVSATGKHAPFDEDNTDGTETAAAVLYEELDNEATASPTDFTAVVINWGAEVRETDLEWGDDLTGGPSDDTVGLPQLAALGIKAR